MEAPPKTDVTATANGAVKTSAKLKNYSAIDRTLLSSIPALKARLKMVSRSLSNGSVIATEDKSVDIHIILECIWVKRGA